MFAAAISKIGYIKWELSVEIWGKKSHHRSRFAEQSVSLSKNSKKMVAQLIFTHQLIIFNSEHIFNNIRQLVCRRWVFWKKYNKLYSHYFFSTVTQ